MTTERRSNADRRQDSRLDMLERDMTEVVQTVRSQQKIVEQMRGILNGLRVASLLVGVALGLYTITQVLAK